MAKVYIPPIAYQGGFTWQFVPITAYKGLRIKYCC